MELDEYIVWFVVSIMLMLYTNLKYENVYLSGFWGLTNTWFGVIVLTNTLFSEMFVIILMSFNILVSIIHIDYIKKKVDKK